MSERKRTARPLLKAPAPNPLMKRIALALALTLPVLALAADQALG
jgi:hypothetical protein